MSVPKILQDIRKLKRDNLVGKYYTPNSDIKTVNSESITTNPLPTTWTGSGSSISNGGYTIESSVSGHTNYPLKNIFDNSMSEYASFNTINNSFSITITLPSEITLEKVKTHIVDNISIDGVYIEGSKDKLTWTELYYQSTMDPTLREHTLYSDRIQPFKYYRWRWELSSLAGIYVYAIQFSSYTIETKRNTLTLPDIPDPLGLNQRILIKTPSYDNLGVGTNDLNSKPIDTVLLPNRYYDLMYDGSKYLAKEVL